MTPEQQAQKQREIEADIQRTAEGMAAHFGITLEVQPDEVVEVGDSLFLKKTTQLKRNGKILDTESKTFPIDNPEEYIVKQEEVKAALEAKVVETEEAAVNHREQVDKLKADIDAVNEAIQAKFGDNEAGVGGNSVK